MGHIEAASDRGSAQPQCRPRVRRPVDWAAQEVGENRGPYGRRLARKIGLGAGEESCSNTLLYSGQAVRRPTHPAMVADIDQARTIIAHRISLDAVLCSDHLDHLDQEEEALAPVLLTWQQWPNR
jgi:hypothetical protein